MGRSSAAALTAHRPRWRSYLLLGGFPTFRPSGPTCLPAWPRPRLASSCPTFLLVAVSASLFYSGGMLLNDAFDADHDRRLRPERPIPAGDVERSEVLAAGAGLLAVGELALIQAWPAPLPGLFLAAAIVAYDYSHKGNRIAPLIMGSCRALVYCVAAVAAAGVLPQAAVIGALIIGAYVSMLTVIAKMAGPHARWLIPVLIAGISLVDAVFIAAASGSPALSLAAASGFLLTLFLRALRSG